MPGSIKRKIIAPELLEERAYCNFDQDELAKAFIGGPEVYKDMLRSQLSLYSEH